ncbi:tryptophan-rich sensory protein [Acidithiobacillus sp.]|jgi:hypothetical protein|uniref:tryptophan-rich sensory protein n=1 Tax=Acidithiobacillus sp. TaxID=1872118 RepID=UPI0025BFD611|nr:tryptophan-rich sensory protein [Acidithiobacillus sp.]MCK9189773.1 tryptophan-rich sensory protein [Acidithiobacillus sp.]MCK9358242.1 tryptophan-rich sensory protein [Acidithiobacillus sp.]
MSREFALLKAESSRSENPNSLCHAVLQPVFAQNGRARLANQSLHATGISPITLLALVLAAIGVFAAINSIAIAALLLVPYGLWLFVALYLNWTIYWLNRDIR